ncbi:MBL fold metallo-hydrolase [Mechercharimyces sp. CAU 1602]|uniref:MBL fold metallo-hydrolase n=1 Tax=Mechercharimyces sp. CAU 1602 TaxID=2973933 RepID=UPI002161EE4E|nr:MBL fold metallo-hydrolase [Mechercharimyces sp. CAU 1602]MCS1352662.1 MBL fold metallo-hydrolase [Mechercharimyces sp. CAU 1602]
MNVSILASGSTGNAIYVESANTRILIDAGLSGKQIEKHLSSIGIAPDSLTALVITHEHIDHVKGMGVLSRRYQLPLYINQGTWDALPSSVGSIDPSLRKLIEAHSTFNIGTLSVTPFSISHDAADPLGFRFSCEETSLGLITDTGYINQQMIEHVRGVDTLIFESNHDTDMLRMGSYPWNIKRRILSDTGHLSNVDAAEALVEILRGEGEQVYLSHLSLDNNLMELAHMTVKERLEEAHLRIGEDLFLYPTYHDRPTPLRPVRGQAVARLS